MMGSLRHWVGFFWPDKGDVSSGEFLKCLFSGTLTSLVVLQLAGVKPWNLYLLSAFADPQFQNKVTFFITLLLAALAGLFSVGYMTNELLRFLSVKRRWLWRSAARQLREWQR
jgi:hypothetical protein